VTWVTSAMYVRMCDLGASSHPRCLMSGCVVQLQTTISYQDGNHEAPNTLTSAHHRKLLMGWRGFG
jgi:hypothetical protein